MDVVAVARAAQLLDRFGSSIVQRVATGPEARWVGDSPSRLGVVLGLKEAAIKAMAGRPADFRWQHVETGLGSMVTSLDALTDRPGGLPPAVGDVLREFATGMGLRGAQVATCRLAPAASSRISPQLAGTGEILGVGVFGADAEPSGSAEGAVPQPLDRDQATLHTRPDLLGPAGIVGSAGTFGSAGSSMTADESDQHVYAAVCFWRDSGHE